MIGMECEILAWDWNEWTENRKIDTMLGFAVDSYSKIKNYVN